MRQDLKIYSLVQIIFYFIIFILIFHSTIYSYNESGVLNLKVNNSFKSIVKNNSIIEDFQCAEIDNNDLINLNITKNDSLLFVIQNENNSLTKYKLKRVNIIKNNLIIKLGSGKIINYNKPLFYQGSNLSNDTSMISLTIFDSSLVALIMTNHGNYTISKVINKNLKNIYTFYNDKNFIIKNPFQCGVDDISTNQIIKKNNNNQLLDVEPILLSCINIDIFFECDYALYQSKGSDVNNVLDFINGIFNSVNHIYNNENINLQISEIFIWDIDDIYYDHTQGITNTIILNQFSEYREFFNGHVAQLLSAKTPYLNSCAWLLENGLCYNNDMDDFFYRHSYANIFGQDYIFPTYSWTVQAVTHELGHQFGSPHTHSCYWPGGPIDNCFTPEGDCNCGPPAPTDGGTIMSYCHGNWANNTCSQSNPGINFLKGFGPLPGAKIRETIYNSRNCLASSYFQNEEKNNISEIIYESPINIYSGRNVTTSKPIGDYVVDYNNQNEYGNIVFHAGNEITLKDGFIANQGSIFTATIDTSLNCFEGTYYRETNSLIKEQNPVLTNKYLYEESKLIDIFPNPSNDNISIKFSIGNSSNTELFITDIYGIQVKNIYNQPIKSGIQTKEVNLSNLTNGVYFVNLKTDNGVFVKKFVVIK